MKGLCMKSVLLFLALALMACTVQAAETVTIVIGSAQDDACEMARTGILRHRGGRGVEGIGMSSESADAAVRRCCFWGTRSVREIGICQSRTGRWYACVRYR